ncbi:MAG: CoA-binding protein [Acidobacteria bacterium]|nr:CoA-binding protein [Acidobacteriota bacterium]
MLNTLFRPRSIAVMGASNNTFSIGNRVVKNLLAHEFKGRIYPINLKEPEILGLRAYPSILDVPEPVDIGMIAVKSTLVPQMVEDCGKKGVKFVIIHTAGFREMGGEGAKLEDQLLENAKKYGVRVYGPNCQGIMNSDPEVSVYANFTFTPMRPGRASILAQSGGVAELLNLNLRKMGSGFRMYASQGNASDVSTNELLDFMGNDPETRTIIMHIESMKDTPEFIECCRRIGRDKALLAIRTGRTTAAAKAVSSHTGSMMQEDSLTDTIFEHAGVMRFDTTEEMISAAYAFASQPVPAGPNVAIVANAGGPGIMAIDECVGNGLKLAKLSEETKARLRAGLIPEAYVENPIDVAATARAEHFALTLSCLEDDPGVDSILITMVTPPFVDCEAVGRAIAETAAKLTKPLVCVVMTNENWASTVETIKGAGIPVFDFPEAGSRVVAAMARYAEIRKHLAEQPAGAPGNKAKAQKILAGAPGEFISQTAAFDVLSGYEIPVARTVKLSGERLPRGLKYPVVLKVDSEAVVHKSDVGGVALNLARPAALKKVHAEMAAHFPGADFVVQEQCAQGTEIIVGLKREPGVGAVIMFGMGGIHVEAMKDVSFRMAPLSQEGAARMIRGIRSLPLLQGFRGIPPADIAAIQRLLISVSQMAVDLPEIVEMDLNPVIVYPEGQGLKVVDVRIRKQQQAQQIQAQSV